MADRFKYSEVRQKIIDAIRTDLIGPREKEEVLEENPRYAYLVGMFSLRILPERRITSLSATPMFMFMFHVFR